MEEETTVANINTGSRKKTKLGRRRQKKKYADDDFDCLSFEPPCMHNTKKFGCLKLRPNDIARNRKFFYHNKGYVEQNTYCSRFIAPYYPQRRRPRYKTTTKTKRFSVSYFLLSGKKTMVPVCKIFFMKALSLGRKRLLTLTETLFAGQTPKENRGGDRKEAIYTEKRQSVRDFIGKLPAQESHYNRKKSKRIYLSCELNITKLHKIYNNFVEPNLQVKIGFFRHIFINDFNIGFTTPATDVCQICTLLANKIRVEKNQLKKQDLITEKRLHKMRSKAFYQLLKKKEPQSLTFCFDMQQVQPLPKTPIQESFYSRQISFYTICMVPADSRNPTFYTWSENQGGRGANEVGSALLTFLSSLNLEQVTKIRLFCDGCGGQNKNSHVIHTLIFWLIKRSPKAFQEIHITYPVRGHSFLPADRVFGRVEKSLRKKVFINTKEEYHQIYSEHGNVLQLGENWELYNIKGLEKCSKKISGIQNLKRIFLKKIFVKSRLQCLVQTFENFRFQSGDEKWENLLKKGQTVPKNLTKLSLKRAISAEKKKDVSNLLEKQFGEEWLSNEDLTWYKEIFFDTADLEVEDFDVQHEDETCDCLEYESSLRI